MKKRVVFFLALTALLILGSPACGKSAKPNFVFILTDDMDSALMPLMEQTNQLIGKEGATLNEHYITTPLCCPSRTSILRGQYAHNTDILDNAPAFKRYFQNGSEAESLPVWLNRAGYETAMIGKYLNLYPALAGKTYIPPGWSEWNAFIYDKDGDHFYFDYTMNENGELVKYGSAPEDYSTDVIKNKSLAFIDESISTGKPFFILISVYAPHGPSEPAPRHAELFADLTYPQKPSFNEADISDKPDAINALRQSGDDFDIGDADRFFRDRAKSLQAVDEITTETLALIESLGQIENTYIIFTSDNGFHLGEHQLAGGKSSGYTEDIHVPFLMRGPGIKAGKVINQMTANIDIAPTIAELAGIDPADFVDGRSIAPLLFDRTDVWRRGVLIEAGYDDPLFTKRTYPALASELPVYVYPESSFEFTMAQLGNISYRGIRTKNYSYLEYNSRETEIYDLTVDPYELQNISQEVNRQFLAELRNTLSKLMYCAADECRKLEDELPDKLP